MKKVFKIFIVTFVLCLIVCAPIVFGAETTKIANPLKVTSIQTFISEALKFVVNLLAIFGVMYIIWTGFMFVAALGNEKKLAEAKKSFLNAVIGMTIILGAWAMAQVIANTINKITNSNDAVIGTK